ncbi:MAG: hypothetical protein K2X34_04740, partial [Hyphomonadaceae bacterium]|nr:hypothetical protein [Hyphomonadaceae bacterium]
MRWLSAFIGSLWRSAQFWRISPIEGVRTGSKLAGCLMFMVMIFTIIAIILVLLGFDLGEVDLWLDAQGGWMDFVGRVLFRGFIWFVFLCSVLCCVVLVWAYFADRESVGSIWSALGGLVVLALIAWVCSSSLFAPL